MKIPIYLILLISFLVTSCSVDPGKKFDMILDNANNKSKVQTAEELLHFARDYPQSKYAPTALLLSGETYLWTVKEKNKAISILKRITTYYPESKESLKALLDIADFHLMKGDYNDSINLLNKALKFKPDPETEKNIKYKLIKSYYFLGDNCLAVKEIDKFIKQYPEYKKFNLIIMKGELYLRCQKPDLAVETYKVLINSGNPQWQKEGILKTANLYFSNGKYREAITFYHKLAKFDDMKKIADKKIALLKKIIYQKHHSE